MDIRLVNNPAEYRRFPFWGTLLCGVFLLLMIRIYWEPSLYPSSLTLTHASKDIWTSGQYNIWGPIWKYGFERIKKGEIPFWNPYQLCGQPYLVDFRTALFQPLHVLFWRTHFSSAYQWYIFLCLFLLGLGFLIWGRILEIPYPALLPGLMSFLFSGPVTTAQMSISFLSGSVWLTLLLCGIVYFLENSTVRSWLVLLFLWIAIILSGSVECIITGIGLLLVAPLILIKLPTLSVSRTISSVLRDTLLILILGLMITSFSWVPGIIWIVKSRGSIEIFHTFPLVTNFPDSLLQLLLNFSSPILNSEKPFLPVIYPGTICLLFIPAAFFDRDQRWSIFFLCSILILFILLFFINLDIAKILQKGMCVLISISLSTLCSIGFSRVLIKGRDVKSPYILISCIIILSLSILIVIVGSPWIKGISIIFGIILIPAVLIRLRRLNKILSIFFALLCFIELFYMFRPFLPESYTSAIEKYEQNIELIKMLRYQTGTGRVYLASENSEILWSENIGMYYHWQMTNGKNIPIDSYTEKWFDQLRISDTEQTSLQQKLENPFLTFSGTQWVLVSRKDNISDNNELKKWRQLERLPFVNIFENMQPLPRCFWVGKFRLSNSLEETLTLLSKSEISPSHECIIETTPDKSTILSFMDTKQTQTKEEIPIEPKPTCNILEETPEKVLISVKSPSEGILVLLDTFNAGWYAKVDDKPTEIFRTNGIFRGIFLPAGVHDIAFEYKMPGWKEGKIISLIGIITTLLLAWVSFLRNKTQDETAV